jgi:hypothetical protein
MENKTFSLTTPLATVEQYSIMTGEDIGVIQGHVNKRLLPCKKIGKRVYINLVLLTNQLAST